MHAALHLFGYLKSHHNARLLLDPRYPDIDNNVFPEYDWEHVYGDLEEQVPANAPEARGKPVDLTMYVDSDHAGEKRTRRSRTGFLIYANGALVQWMSKKQPTVETSVFGAEFVALKHGTETLRGIRYKLRMMGVEPNGPNMIFGDNMSVVTNSQKPESTLNKKSNSICYHAVRESVAMGESLVAHVRSEDNLADLLTKIITGEKRKGFVRQILMDIYDLPQ